MLLVVVEAPPGKVEKDVVVVVAVAVVVVASPHEDAVGNAVIVVVDHARRPHVDLMSAEGNVEILDVDRAVEGVVVKFDLCFSLSRFRLSFFSD